MMRNISDQERYNPCTPGHNRGHRQGLDNNYFSRLSTAPKLDYFELIDSLSCPSSMAPFICYVFYVIINTLFYFDDTCAYLITFSSIFTFLY